MPVLGFQWLGGLRYSWHLEQCAPYSVGECIAGARIYRRHPNGNEDKEAAFTPKVGKGGRMELWVHIPCGKWTAFRQVRLARGIGWHFSRPHDLTWEQFLEKVNGQFVWQADHLNKDYRVDTVPNIQIVRAAVNRARYAADPQAHIGVRKRPARA